MKKFVSGGFIHLELLTVFISKVCIFVNQTESYLKLRQTDQDLRLIEIEALGQHLDLPPFLESRRDEIEAKLHPLERSIRMEKYRIDQSKGMEFGLYSLGDHIINPLTGNRISAQQRIHELIEASKLAEQAGIDVFGVGESHQTYFTSQGHTVILGAIAQATEKIKLTSSATVLSVLDPVRVYEDFATIDLISNGRAEIVAGRGSRVGAYHLLGVDLQDYEEIFEEKLELLKQINEQERVTWQGEFRAPLENAEILPQPKNGSLPIWRAVGGPPASAIKAGDMGIPMMLTTLGGPAMNFKLSVDAYREAAQR